MRKKWTKFLPFFLAGIFFIVGLITIGDYGINWDEPVHFMRGQAYLRYFLTGKKNYQGLPKLEFHYPKNDRYKLTGKTDYEDDRFYRRSLYQHDYWNGEWFFANDKPHPPVGGLLAALSNYIFYQKLGWLGDIEAYHLFEVLCGAATVFLVTLWAQKTLGNIAAFTAGLSLGTYPLFWAESHFNIKDPVQACFFSFALFSFWQAEQKRSLGWLGIFSLFTGLALGTKLNIIFLAPILGIWLLAKYRQKIIRFIWPVDRFSWGLFLSPFLIISIFILFWPFLWHNLKEGLVAIWYYYREIGLNQRFQPASYYWGGVNTYPIQALIFTTPLITGLLALVGILVSLSFFKKDKNKTAFLWLVWFLMSLTRVTIIKGTIYGGLRQIMEYIPAMALLAGLGATNMVRWLHGYMVKDKKLFSHLAIQLLILLMFLPIAFKMIQIHPNESLYFNPLIGGLKGAAEKNFPHWGMSLGNEYRQGIEWFNQYAPPEANLTLARGFLSNIPRIWIRKDINFGDYYFSGPQKQGEYIMEVTHQGWEDFVPQKAAYLKTLEPVYELKVGGVTVLAIWHNR